MKVIFLTIFFLVVNAFCHGQQLFQDASGNTQIYIGQESLGYLFYNTTDKSATLGYNHSNDSGGHDYYQWEMDLIYGFDVKLKTSEGIANFFSGNQLKPGFTISGNIGLFKDNWLQRHHFLNLLLRPTIGYNQYSYINTDVVDYKVKDVKKVEVGFLLNFSTQFNLTGTTNGQKDKTKHSYIFAMLQTGFKQTNNYEDLDDGEVITIVTQSGTNTIQTTKTGKLGNYESSNVLPLNLDFAYTPCLFKTNYIGFNTYYRTNFFKKVNTSNAGIGMYLANPKKPSQISGGIGWQFNDLYNKLEKGGSLVSRSTAFFYVGYAIGAQ